ncbi:guanylate kinase [Conglomerata obtusa]
MRDKRHIIISGPSGSGKSTITALLVKSDPRFKFSVSHTTRPIRPSENHGLDYFFVTKVQFEDMIDKNKFIEYATYNGHYYGTSTSQFENAKRVLIIDVERQGVMNLKEDGYDFRYVYVYTDKESVLERLVGRSRVKGRIAMEQMAEISRRLEEYDKDMNLFEKGVYDIGVKNNCLKQAFNEIENYLYSTQDCSSEEDSSY